MADRMFASTRKGLIEYGKAGGAWSHTATHFIGQPVTNMLADGRDGTLYAALDLGHFGVKVHRSSDAGATWHELDSPKYPTAPEGEDGPSLKMIWMLAAGAADQPGRVWAGTLPGGLFRSDDRGDTWHLVESLWTMPERQKWFGGGADEPGIHSICIDPRDGKRIAIGVSCGGVWVSEDDGGSWRVGSQGMWAAYVPEDAKYDPGIQDCHLIVQCPAAPDVWWCQHHNAMFRCADDLQSWHELTDVPVSNFGFPVAVHPHDPDTAWFAPAKKDEFRYPVDGKVIVNRTRDGGKTFETLRNGLPQDNAFDLIYRHAFKVDDTGEELLMGSTTGALWHSANGGDSWQLITAHLAPVYAVTFG